MDSLLLNGLLTFQSGAASIIIFLNGLLTFEKSSNETQEENNQSGAASYQFWSIFFIVISSLEKNITCISYLFYPGR